MSESPPPAPAPDGPGTPPDWEQLARLLSPDRGVPDPATAAWLAANPTEAAHLDRIDRALNAWARAEHAGQPVAVEEGLAAMRARRASDAAPPPLAVSPGGASRRTPAPAQRAPRVAVWVGLAAAAAVGFVALRRPAAPVVVAAAARYVAPIGARDSVRLGDGTRVRLAPGSTLEVGPGYGSAHRTVLLNGEGWFDVVHDGEHPFVVAAQHATVRDIGTAFAVVADPGRPVRVIVTAGQVAVRTAGSAGEVQLGQGDVATIPVDTPIVIARQAAVPEDTAWMQGRLVFREAALDEVARTLARWYGVRLVVADRVLDGRHVTATFDGEPRERVLELLALALGARVEQRGDSTILRAARP
jgi:transmembrane sensor